MEFNISDGYIFDYNITVSLPITVDLSPEQQKLLIELRRKKQELLLEIQVSQRP